MYGAAAMAIKFGLRRVILQENLHRERHGQRPLTQSEIAAGIGVTQSVISKLLNAKNRRIDFDTLDRLCAFFKITPAELFEYTPTPAAE